MIMSPIMMIGCISASIAADSLLMEQEEKEEELSRESQGAHSSCGSVDLEEYYKIRAYYNEQLKIIEESKKERKRHLLRVKR